MKGRLTAFLLGTIFALLLAEAALRLGGAALGLLQAGAGGHAPGTYTIMCLGESTTAGGEWAWPAKMQEALAGLYGKRAFSVVNKGLSGTNTSGIMTQLPGWLAETRPDMVIAMMGMNDGFVRYYDGIKDPAARTFRYVRVYRLLQLTLNGKRLSVPAYGPARAVRPDPYELFRASSPAGGAAESALRAGAASRPGDADSLYLLGRYLVQRKSREPEKDGPFREGERLLLKALELRPGDEYALTALGEAYAHRNEAKRGLELLRRAAEVSHSDQSLWMLGKAYKDSGRYEEAEAVYAGLLASKSPGIVQEEALSDLCFVYMKQKKYAELERLLGEALAGDPANEKLLGALAGLYTATGRPALARACDEKLSARRALFNRVTLENFARLRALLKARGIKLAVMQYPMCALAPLRKALGNPPDVIFIDNDAPFKRAVARDGYTRYFVDMFAGNFGHCTHEGNELIARDAAAALRAFFGSAAPKTAARTRPAPHRTEE